VPGLLHFRVTLQDRWKLHTCSLQPDCRQHLVAPNHSPQQLYNPFDYLNKNGARRRRFVLLTDEWLSGDTPYRYEAHSQHQQGQQGHTVLAKGWDTLEEHRVGNGA